MFHLSHNNINLLARDEGKIKSYESCFDIRAWSHDPEIRVRYLRDWIKSDMPICVIPVSTVTSSLRMMSWKRRGSVIPRCHPDCKAKVVLDSICNSCHAIKECFKDNDSFQKYFEEEKFEFTYWPCERCLEALKSIKMFWRIILEKIFQVKFPKSTKSNSSRCSFESVKSIARIWQEEIVEEAIFVKNFTPFIKDELGATSLKTHSKYRSNEISSKKNIRNNISTDTDFKTFNADVKRKSSAPLLCKKLSKCTSVKTETLDVGCGTCFVDKVENNTDKYNLDYLQQQFSKQSDELRQLKRDNISLKLELRNKHKNCVPTLMPMQISDNNIEAPKPFESCFEQTDTVKAIESEMVITMKNCKNKNFSHVSMLQVLHKTNDILTKDILNGNYRKKEDPLDILTKVHNTFGAIVKRELGIANKKANSKDINIDAYHTTNADDQRFSAKSSLSNMSDAIFVSATQVL